MDDRFDIIDYISGLTCFTFDKAVLKRIALDRGVYGIDCYHKLDSSIKDLLYADLLYTAYCSPNTWSSYTQSHGSFTKSIGSQNIDSQGRERMYNRFMSIYRKYNDAKLEAIEDEGTVQFID